MFVLAFCCTLYFWTAVCAAEDNALAALQECGNLHQLEFRNIPEAKGEYSNGNCLLKCSIGTKVLSTDSLNEGFLCPLNSNGKCHNGECIITSSNGNAPAEAQRECGNIHHLDAHSNNSSLSAFSNSKCTLKCYIDGKIISENLMNQGLPCPENANGICRDGECVATTAPPTVSTTVPSTIHEVTINPQIGQIQSIHLQVMQANIFNQTYTQLSAAACVETTGWHLPFHFAYCSHERCITHDIAQNTAYPIWGTDCDFNALGKRDFLTIGLFHRTSNGGFYTLGTYVVNVQQLLINQNGTIEQRNGTSYFGFSKPNCPIMHGKDYIGDFYLHFNLTLSH